MHTFISTCTILAGFSFLVPQLAEAREIAANELKTEVKLASEINWQQLNPARGDRSPKSGTIWGDQTKDGESGFLVKFIDGFSSPPHIHNITYRGIVLGGSLHNDDPEAEPMWMKVGSYWTQPAGEVHITSARGPSVCYVEIQSGPYLVKPPNEAFDNGERPVNIDATNIIWLDVTDTKWSQGNPRQDSTRNPKIAFLWGSPEGEEVNGTMVKLPAGFSGTLYTGNSQFKVIVIQGESHYHSGDIRDIKKLTAGSYLGSEGKSSHHLACENECIIYVRTRGKYSIVPD